VYKVHSELFGEDILVCERDGERGKVDDGDIVRYTLAEVRELKKVADKATLRVIHVAKKQLRATVDAVEIGAGEQLTT